MLIFSKVLKHKEQMTMVFGRKTKDPTDTREITDLIARRELLQQKLATARTALDTATDVRRTSLLDADLSDEEACRRRDQLCRDARDAVESLGDAITEINSKISDAEIKLAAARENLEREQIAAATRADADALHAVALALREVSNKVVAHPRNAAGADGRESLPAGMIEPPTVRSLPALSVHISQNLPPSIRRAK
jgi:hypothetical protein